MSFDTTNPADLAALQSELVNDPLSVGYAAAQGVTAQILKLLNDPANNPGGESASRPFDIFALRDALDPTDYDSPQTSAFAAQYTHFLAELAAYSSIESEKLKWRSMFAGNSATVAALDAQNVLLSRAEVLFGQGTTISKADYVAARDYTP